MQIRGLTTFGRPGWVGAVAFAACCLAGASSATAQGWPSYAHDPQHTCQAVGASQIPQMIRWSTPVDIQPQYSGGGELLIHYGSPVITRVNTVLVPVKTGQSGQYQVKAINGTTGAVVWTSPISDYTLPSYDWVPIFGITLTPKDKYVVYPGGGGTIYARTFPDSTLGVTSQFAFYNKAATFNSQAINYYAENPAEFDAAIQICTPISSDALGNLFFGYISTGNPLPGYPNGIPSGFARVSSAGVGTFVAASTMTPDRTITQVAYNCSPSYSNDGSTVYVAVNNGSGKGYLVALNSTTLATTASVLLVDPSNGQNAYVDNDGSSTPTVGPDGDVYYGVLSSNIANNNFRGFLLHFNSNLTVTKTPSSFGWDDTPSIVPASLVPSYTGPSSYLLLTKYNNYADGGGDGLNRVAIVDPNTAVTTAVTGANSIQAMQPVISVLGVMPNVGLPGVREWCINSAAIDPINKCAVVNSEDGHVYRWSFVTNTLSAGLYLAQPTGEAYTPTVIGPDGAVYAINNAQLFCCVAGGLSSIGTPVGQPIAAPAKPIAAPGLPVQ